MDMMPITIAPISGFPERQPAAQAIFDRVIAVIEKHYNNAGAVNIETPLVERTAVLTAKAGGAVNKEIYGLRRLSDSDDGSTADLGLRFDLTVPLARYVAQHQGILTFPFRRRHVGNVYRGERSQAGRYREFTQADFDIIGRDTLSNTADAEPPSIIYGIFSELSVGPFVIRINNRKILQGYFAEKGFDELMQKKALAVIDKADAGRDATVAELCKVLGSSASDAEAIIDFIGLTIDVANPAAALAPYKLNPQMEEGINELCHVLTAVLAFGVPKESLKADLEVARGLDYYTGTVYETVLLDHESLGSVCSGGRYDELTERFAEGSYPGVGISIGVTRLVTRLIEADILSTENAFARHVLVTQQDEALLLNYLALAAKMRKQGIPTEVFFDTKGLGQQLRYASKKGFGFAIIVGADEKARGVLQVKHLLTGDQRKVLEVELINYLKEQT